MKKSIILLLFLVSTVTIHAENTKPKYQSEKHSTTIPVEMKSDPPTYTYCSTCNGIMYCATSRDQLEAITLFLQMCETLGCC